MIDQETPGDVPAQPGGDAVDAPAGARPGRRLTCSDYSFPALPLRGRLAIVEVLGFERVDLGAFLDDPAPFCAEPHALTRELEAALAKSGLEPADLFFSTGGDDFVAGAPNHREPHARALNRRAYEAALGCARALGIGGVTVVPGVTWAGDAEGAWACCVEELRWRVDRAAAREIELRVEPHVGSIVPTPELVADLLGAVPGLRLSLDAAHFVSQSISVDRIAALAPLAGHVHVRAARPGRLQVAWHDDETDFPGLVEALAAAGYTGCYCVEYVHMARWGCDEIDVVTETVATRDALAALGIA